MKQLQPRLNEAASDTNSCARGGQEEVFGQGVGEPNEPVSTDPGPSGSGVEPQVRAKFKPKGSSITLEGCGRRDGSTVDHSMGLVEAYKLILGI